MASWLVLALGLAAAAQPPAELARQVARRGFQLLQQGKLEAAEHELRQAVRLAPNEPLALAVLGMVLVQRSQLEEAAGFFERALAADPTDTGTRYNLASVLLRLGRPEEAREHLERTLREKPDHKQAAALLDAARETGYEIALKHYRAGRYSDSQALLEKMIAAGNREPRVFSLLAWSHHRQGRREPALAAIQRAIEAAPEAATWYSHAAQILLENRDYQTAYRTALRALASDPRFAPALKLKGRIELERGASRQALDSFIQAGEADPSDPEARLWLAAARKALRQYEEAAATLEKGIATFPDYAAFYAAYGRLLLEPELRSAPGAEVRARAMLEKALALDPTAAPAHYELGKLLLEEGRAAEALPHLESAARLDPAAARNYLALADAYRLLGRLEEQRRALERFRQLKASEETPR